MCFLAVVLDDLSLRIAHSITFSSVQPYRPAPQCYLTHFLSSFPFCLLKALCSDNSNTSRNNPKDIEGEEEVAWRSYTESVADDVSYQQSIS